MEPTPEVEPAVQEPTEGQVELGASPNSEQAPAKKSWFAKLPRWQLYVGLAVIVIIVGTITASVLAFWHQTSRSTGCEGDTCNEATPNPSPTVTPTPSATAMPVARLLDGILVPPRTDKVRPLAVMIDNHPDARPQSGLVAANLVYEALTEGGVTRYMAVYANPDQTKVRVGPIRSLRSYYLDFAREFNASLAHVGGSVDALDSLAANGGVEDIDQLNIGAPIFERDLSRNVAAEHTMYSTVADLWVYVTSQNQNTAAAFAPLLFTDDLAQNARPASETVGINFSTSDYAVNWVYDPASNTYARSLAGKPQKDAETGQQITAKDIIIETVPHTPVVTRLGQQVSQLTLTGSGKAVVIENGTATPATWKRDGTNRTRYYDANDSEIKLVRGTEWVEVVYPETTVTY